MSQNVATVKYVAPPVMVLRPGSLTHVKPGDALHINDVLVTGPEGRALVILQDASEVTLGPRTEIRVVIHDPATQQTLIEMLHGRVRTKVTPVTKAGGFFKVATPTAVAYALGSEIVTETVNPVVDTSEPTLAAETLKHLKQQQEKERAGNNLPATSPSSSSTPGAHPLAADIHSVLANLTDLSPNLTPPNVNGSQNALDLVSSTAPAGTTQTFSSQSYGTYSSAFSADQLPDPEAGIGDTRRYNWGLIFQYLIWILSDSDCPPERCFVGGGMAEVDPPALQIEEGPPTPPVHSVIGDLTFNPGESLTIDRIEDNRHSSASTSAQQIGQNWSFNPESVNPDRMAPGATGSTASGCGLRMATVGSSSSAASNDCFTLDNGLTSQLPQPASPLSPVRFYSPGLDSFLTPDRSGLWNNPLDLGNSYGSRIPTRSFALPIRYTHAFATDAQFSEATPAGPRIRNFDWTARSRLTLSNDLGFRYDGYYDYEANLPFTPTVEIPVVRTASRRFFFNKDPREWTRWERMEYANFTAMMTDGKVIFPESWIIYGDDLPSFNSLPSATIPQLTSGGSYIYQAPSFLQTKYVESFGFGTGSSGSGNVLRFDYDLRKLRNAIGWQDDYSGGWIGTYVSAGGGQTSGGSRKFNTDWKRRPGLEFFTSYRYSYSSFSPTDLTTPTFSALQIFSQITPSKPSRFLPYYDFSTRRQNVILTYIVSPSSGYQRFLRYVDRYCAEPGDLPVDKDSYSDFLAYLDYYGIWEWDKYDVMDWYLEGYPVSWEYGTSYWSASDQFFGDYLNVLPTVSAGAALSDKSIRYTDVTTLLDVPPGQLGPTFQQPLSIPVGGTLVTPLFHYAGVVGLQGPPLYLNTLQSAFVPANGSATEVGVSFTGTNVSLQLEPVSNKLPSPKMTGDFSQLTNSLSRDGFGIDGKPCVGEVNVNGISNSSNPQVKVEFTGTATSTPLIVAHVSNSSPCPATIIVKNGAVFEPSHILGAKTKGLFGALAGIGLGAATGVTVVPVGKLEEYQPGTSSGVVYTVPVWIAADAPDTGLHDRAIPHKGGGKEPAEPKPNEVLVPVRSFCLDIHKLAPHPQTAYKFGDESKQRELGPYGEVTNRVFRAVQSGEVKLPPGHSLDSATQWTLWASIHHLDAKKFNEEYLHIVEKNLHAQNKKLDKDTREKMEQSAAQLFSFVQHFLPGAPKP